MTGIVLTSLDDEDYGLDPYLVIGAGDLIYKYVFEDAVPLEDIHIEEPLEITLLGEEYIIIEASSNEITVRSGTEIDLSEGESKTIGGNKITVIAVMEESVSVKVNGVSKTVYLDDFAEISGVEVLVTEIVYQGYAEGVKLATLIVGENVEDTYKDGDDFNDEETFKWIIDLPGHIGVTNQEEYKQIDADEDYKALSPGKQSYYCCN